MIHAGVRFFAVAFAASATPWFVAGASAVPATFAVYRLTIGPETRDTFLPVQPKADLWFALDAAKAPLKSRVMLLGALSAGRHRVHLEVSGETADRTFVLALPFAHGHSHVELDIAGAGRFDVGLFAGDPKAPTKEYRYTFTAPVGKRVFEIDLP